MADMAAHEAEYPNPKLEALLAKLKETFTNNPRSRAIIFVKMRRLTGYMASWLLKADERFKAKRFVSTGEAAENAGE